MRGYQIGHNIRVPHPLKDEIYKRGMTLKECADRSELSVYTVQNIIVGRAIPKRDTVERIAKTLDMPFSKVWELI